MAEDKTSKKAGAGKGAGARSKTRSTRRKRRMMAAAAEKDAGRKKKKKPAPVDLDSPNVQEYLEAVYTLTEEKEHARTSELAQILGVKPASVTGMVQKLSDAGLVEYRKYRGVSLTPEGMKVGRKMKRKHRILESFLHNVLGIHKDRVHDQACAMEHSLSDEAERAMCHVLGHPDVCADDKKPIPPCEVKLANEGECKGGGQALGDDGDGPNLVALTELKPGIKATVAFIRGGTTVIRRLNDMGLTPDTPVEIEEVAPFKGPLQLKVRGSSLVVGRGIAAKIFVMA